MQGLLRWSHKCNDVDPSQFQPFEIDNKIVGLVPADYVELLCQAEAFRWCEGVRCPCASVQKSKLVPACALMTIAVATEARCTLVTSRSTCARHDTTRSWSGSALVNLIRMMASQASEGKAAMQLSPGLATQEQRTAAVAPVFQQLRAEGRVPGWRDELYPVASSFGAEPELLVERAAAPLLGIKGYGVHVNGYVRKAGGLHLWVARRSADKPSWPGKLDHIAAGGQVRVRVDFAVMSSAGRAACTFALHDLKRLSGR
jgi:Domain of unknown function (DUF4743)